MGLLGPPAFPQKAVFEAQTERKVSRWENKLEENTGTQVWEVCVFSPARHAPGKGLEAGNQLTPPPPQRPGSGPGSSGTPGSSGALAGAEHCFSKCGPRTRARPQAACSQLLRRKRQELRVSL